MIYTTVVRNENMIVVDGYSNKKTIKGAIADLAKEVAKVSEIEATNLKEYGLELMETMSEDDDYYIECEEVATATKINSNDEIEYKEAKYYLMIRFVA